ncbi:MAG TPA: phosphoenolpyruvate--protein phosphotransferase [Vicinamibacteria bacterium]|nr:phosphoenolpyruvate--protein phosphotransferase [Vicinamibacteria bacterium]
MELAGVGVSPGIAVGEALLVEREAIAVFRLLLPPGELEGEVQRLRRAVEASREQLQAIKERLARQIGSPHAYLFDAQLLMLEDPMLLDRTVAVIREEHLNAAWALRTVAERLQALFEEFSDAYLKERRTDLDDVLGRIQLNLAGTPGAPSLSRLPRPHVLVAEEIPPSEAAELDWENILAVITDGGSATSHTAILARSRGVPAVVGLRDATRRIPAGALVVVDGERGRVEVEPSQPALAGYRAAQERARVEEERLQGTRALKAATRDGVGVRLLANAEFPEEARTAALYGAEGIGLFRSEYLLGRALTWPSEERQVEVYQGLLDAVSPFPVTIRTWDVGREDLAPGGPSSPNPALGERALRLLARDPAPFLAQVRALLRAAAHGPIRMMFPFVGGPRDLRLARELVGRAVGELAREGLPFRADVPVGLTLELPSAALTADLLAREADFFSVGTNDLIQYLLAVDRMDPRVAPLYEPLHPAVLRAVKRVVDAADAAGRPVSVCGEMAADPLQALVLIGLGVRELSMSPAAIPRVKAAVRAATAASARSAAAACLDMATAEEIEDHLRRALGLASGTGVVVPS